jgi:hypothetical protein
MNKKIYVHIGLHKTGTTSIQALLHNNANQLHKHGIYYPTIHNNHGKILYSMFAKNPQNYHANIKDGYLTTKAVKKLNQKYKKHLERKICSPKIHTVIFSGEDLSTFTKEELENFHRWLNKFSSDVTIICCTRNPVSWYNSLIQQRLKGRRQDIIGTCGNLPLKQRARIKRLLTNYINCFGRGHVIVYDFDTHKHELYKKFMTSCSINPDIITTLLEQDARPLGGSLSQEACLILDSLNSIRPWKKEKKQPFYEPKYLEKIKGNKFRLEKSLLKSIISNGQEEMDWLAENFHDECGYYKYWQKQLDQAHQKDRTLFDQEAIESIALLISDLVNENIRLKNSPKMSLIRPITHLIKNSVRRSFLARRLRRYLNELTRTKKTDKGKKQQ